MLRPARMWVFFFGLWAFPVPGAAQSSAPAELRAHRLTVAPRLDGLLDDEAWSGQPLPLDGWVSYNPMRGEAAAETTRVWA